MNDYLETQAKLLRNRLDNIPRAIDQARINAPYITGDNEVDIQSFEHFTELLKEATKTISNLNDQIEALNCNIRESDLILEELAIAPDDALV